MSRSETGADGAGAFLVGRDREIQGLHAAWADAANGRGRVFLILGEPGVGKTALADELADHAAGAGALVCWGRCWEAEGAPAYRPWVQVLRTVVRRAGSEGAELGPGGAPLAEIIPEITSSPGPSTARADAPAVARFELFDAVLTYLSDVASDQPLLVVLDDLHAADEASLQLAGFVAREIRSSRILVLCTCRDDELDRLPSVAQAVTSLAREGDRIQLGGLSQEDTVKCFEQVAGYPPPPNIALAVYRATEGNPFFIREVARQLGATGDIHRPDRSMGFRVPKGLQDLLRARLEPLADDVQSMLRSASVIGREFDASLLQKVTDVDMDSLLDVLAKATRAGVLRESSALGRYSFSHVLIRELLYEDLQPSDRRRLHAQLADAIEELYADDLEPHLGELADHFFKAAQAADMKKGLDYAIHAAVSSMTALGYEQAAHHYHRALRLADLVGLARERRARLEDALAEAEEKARAVTADEVPSAVPAATPRAPQDSEGDLFLREGDYWTLSFQGQTARLKDAKGLHYIAQLLARPNEELHSLDLVSLVRKGEPAVRTMSGAAAAQSGLEATDLGDAGEILDPEARAAYKRRLEELREELEEAEAFNDTGRAERARQEIDFLAHELSAAVGLGGRSRKAASASERARVSVTRAIRSAMSRIDDEIPGLGRHLDSTVRTGTFCSYTPDPRLPVSWRV